ncbi:MAG: hypothetical protein KGI49_03820 [Patescibacteria group bacterium]|nr:hypothetical protein [Patescibacteria group bacterium]
MTDIIPAILPKDFAELVDKIELIKGFVKAVQIDVCDGQFVPNATWPYRKHDDSFEKIAHEELGLPSWQELDYEFDLMVNRPEEVVEEWVVAGAARLVIHAEAKGDVSKALEMIQGLVEAGLALNESTDLAVIEKYRDKISFVQLMGIDRIGFQGQPFDERVVGRIKQVRLAHPALPISIDGGVSLQTAQELIAAGADRLIVGSAIFGAENPIEAVSDFKRL